MRRVILRKIRSSALMSDSSRMGVVILFGYTPVSTPFLATC